MTKVEKEKILPYNPCSARSIVEYGELLLGHSLKDLYPDAQLFKGKGGLGNSVELFHYKYQPNSEAEPDFSEAGLELKCTPLKLLKDKSMASKERLVLNIINYIEEADKTFITSSFWRKNKFLLLMFYLHKSGVDPVDMIFKLIRTWRFPEEDLKIIKDDWNIIHKMIIEGHAEDLTEGLTFYLAACMKGSKAGEDMRDQPFSRVQAQQRAYSLKLGYMNKIVFDSFLQSNLQHQLNLTPKRVKYLTKKYSAEKIVKSSKSYRRGETFADLVIRRIQPYYGMTIKQIQEKTGVQLNPSKKDLAYDISRAIFGVKTKKIQEFENAGVLMKSVTFEANGKTLREHMSFPYFRYCEIVNQEWEDSDWYISLTSKFFFVVFRKSRSKDKLNMTLEKVLFWNMPIEDLKICKSLWNDTKQKVINGDYNNFQKQSSSKVCHVRPHGTKGHKVDTPQHTKEQPKCFWLNNKYIRNIIKPTEETKELFSD